ncbi:hypothetical protein SB717_38005, partial [Priestia sp. SIMBA_032]
SNDAYEFGDVRASEGIDPTWDAGVIVKRVSVGDRVWYDKDKNGKQENDDKGQPLLIAEQRTVQTGERRDGVVVVSKGLQAGEQ